jgi:hypothetical protein
MVSTKTKFITNDLWLVALVPDKQTEWYYDDDDGDSYK